MNSGEGVILDGRHGVHLPHCYLIVTPAVVDQVVIVNFTSVKENTAESWLELLADVGDHPFIEAPSCIPFSKAVLFTKSKLTDSMQRVQGTVTYSKMDPALHARIISGLLNSKHTPRNVKRFIIENFGEPAFKAIKACIIDPH